MSGSNGEARGGKECLFVICTGYSQHGKFIAENNFLLQLWTVYDFQSEIKVASLLFAPISFKLHDLSISFPSAFKIGITIKEEQLHNYFIEKHL